jgi:nucleotide-binding universal stress UspA family protein
MISSMLVGVSGTQYSRAAVEYAIQVAAERRVTLTGLSVVDRDCWCPPEAVPLGASEFKHRRDEAVLQMAHQRSEELLSEFERCCYDAGITAQVLKMEGDPADLLCTEAQRVDLLVVGKKHLPEEDAEACWHTLGSILHQSPRPVLCVPTAVMRRGCALIAYDGSLQAAKTLQLFVNCGMAANREVHLLTVGDDGDAIAQRGLDFLRVHSIQAEPHVGVDDHASHRILDVATHIHAELIVMGAYGRTRIHELVFGSVTKRVLQATTVPVFLYH